MVSNFTVFGCCASRDVFNSQINYNYKDYFKVGNDAFHMSIISLMSNPVDYDENLINNFEGEMSDYNLGLIKKDLSKSFLDDLKNDNYEYMLFDTYFDVMHGVVRLNNENTYITNTRFLHQTEFFKKTNNKDILTIKNNPVEYIKLWIDSCKKFFDYVGEFCPNMKIILNPVRGSTKAIDNGEIVFHESYRKFIPNHCFRSILDEYVLNNYDVDTLIFNESHLLDDNHKFGAAEIHYGYSYFNDVTNQLNDIISKDNSLDSEISKDIRSLKRKLLVSKLNEDIAVNNQNTIINLIEKLNEDSQSENSIKSLLDSNIIGYWDKFLDNGYNKYAPLLSRYMCARFDIKNYGVANNSIEVLNLSDSNAEILYPPWFRNNKGQGVVIQSEKGYLHIKLKCINKGKLVIDFKGPDFKDRQKNQIPVYIDYTSLKINNQEFINENLFTRIDKSYEVEKLVENSEVVDIEIKWMPLNSSRLFY